MGRDRTGALIEHWNGRTWKIQPSPYLAGSDLLGVTAISPTNAWAAGSDDHDTLVEHWNGRTWKVQASPNPQFVQSQYLELSGMAATSSTNAWAVGYAYSSFMFPSPLSDQRHTLIEHWNGKAWTVQAGPDLGAGQLASQLLGVAATRSTNVWAVGSNGDSSLIEHWNGKAWNVQPSPNPAGTRSTTCPPGLRATPWRWVPTAPTRPTPGLSPRDAAEQQASCGPTLSPDAFSLLEKTRASAHLS